MNGRRRDVEPHLMEPGDYGRTEYGWYARTPAATEGGEGFGGNLNSHEVTEHEDGTITVSPSILVYDGKVEAWHGYLERGVWRSV